MDEWAMLTHVPLRVDDNERIIDAFAVRCWASGKGFERHAFEVKVSRSDFRNETPEKRAPAEVSAHRCAYVVPAGLLKPEEIPPGWGLVEVYENAADRPWHSRGQLGSRARWTLPAARRKPTCDLDYLVTAGFRRASRAEAEIRHGDVPAAEVVRLRQEVESLSGMLSRAKTGKQRETARAKRAESELLAAFGDQQFCADCDQPLLWKRESGGNSRWAHVDPAQEKPCSQARADADRRRKEAATGAKYGWGMAGDPEPKATRERRLAAEQEMENAS
jgi:hypothetical protein